ncbi:phosphotransferase [Actinomycetospora soli]|uniref:phosphotransferase n=1 Tax=Actinomycetospora soli TaxID=2893887 RepID=UPI001E41A8B8|nr:phosphotransferase [Actinomycetospora soli]MCD2186367.1 aminoglycoside phosphotransferase family protein [Actinomycetospora soli]
MGHVVRVSSEDGEPVVVPGGSVEVRFAAELAWADGHVRRTGPPDARERSWASVLRLPTAAGPVWLKVTTPRTRAEVGLYRLLVATAPDAVLVPLAHDEARGLLLLPDGGPTLADAPRPQLGPALAGALARYGRLQRAMAPRRAEMLALGVPDAAPEALDARCAEAVAVTGLPDGGSCRAAVAGWAARLADAPAADLVTVDHQDLHPGNVLASGRFYDWGDAVVAHPFASMLVGLGGLARTLGVEPDEPVVHTARDAYLDVFADLAPHAELVATCELACRAAVVARALTWQRAVGDAGPDHPLAGAARETLARWDDPSPFAAA